MMDLKVLDSERHIRLIWSAVGTYMVCVKDVSEKELAQDVLDELRVILKHIDNLKVGA